MDDKIAGFFFFH